MSLFEYDWIDAGPYPDPVSEHTMARLWIRLDEDDAATYLYDRYKKRYAESIVVPLAQLAEWITTNWFHVWHEVDTISEKPRAGFASRHDLSYAGSGFVFPRVIFDPVGQDNIHVRTRSWTPKHSPIEFLSEFEHTMTRDRLEEEFRSLINDVLERLQRKGVPCEFLESEWQAIESLDPEEYEFCQATALLGLDPFNLDSETAEHIVAIWNEADPSIRDEMMLCADKDSLDEVHSWINSSIEFANESASGAAWPEVRDTVRNRRTDSNMHMQPWQNGYEDARAVRSVLGMRLAHFPLEESGSLAIWNQEQEPPSPRIEGCVANDSPSCIVVNKHGAGKRFILARALGAYIGREQGESAILNKLRTPQQARSRAFAAELLAPSEWLRDKVGDVQYVDSDTVDELATELEVSSPIVQHQIENHGIAKVYGAGW